MTLSPPGGPRPKLESRVVCSVSSFVLRSVVTFAKHRRSRGGYLQILRSVVINLGSWLYGQRADEVPPNDAPINAAIRLISKGLNCLLPEKYLHADRGDGRTKTHPRNFSTTGRCICRVVENLQEGMGEAT